MILNSDRLDVNNVLIIVSDGKPRTGPDASVAVDYARSLGIVIVGIFVSDASGNGDEYLLSISSSPQHFINASIQSNINMSDAFLILFNRLCELSEVKVGGEVEISTIDSSNNLIYMITGYIAVISIVSVLIIKKNK